MDGTTDAVDMRHATDHDGKDGSPEGDPCDNKESPEKAVVVPKRRRLVGKQPARGRPASNIEESPAAAHGEHVDANLGQDTDDEAEGEDILHRRPAKADNSRHLCQALGCRSNTTEFGTAGVATKMDGADKEYCWLCTSKNVMLATRNGQALALFRKSMRTYFEDNDTWNWTTEKLRKEMAPEALVCFQLASLGYSRGFQTPERFRNMQQPKNRHHLIQELRKQKAL
eukprot:7844905-Karenia_brevis.AAC.1